MRITFEEARAHADEVRRNQRDDPYGVCFH